MRKYFSDARGQCEAREAYEASVFRRLALISREDSQLKRKANSLVALNKQKVTANTKRYSSRIRSLLRTLHTSSWRNMQTSLYVVVVHEHTHAHHAHHICIYAYTYKIHIYIHIYMYIYYTYMHIYL